MAGRSEVTLSFSQRNGMAAVPPQLKLNEISSELRRLVFYAVVKDMNANTKHGYDHSYFDQRWKALALDLHVKFFRQTPTSFRNRSFEISGLIEGFIAQRPFNEVFDLIEFLIRNRNFDPEVAAEIAQAFIDCRAAYRVMNQQIGAVGSSEQAEALERAITDTATKGLPGARTHLMSASSALRQGDWASSVRESIHAVESAAVRLAPGTETLGAALKVLERQGKIHGALKSAFEKLYGYSSDQEGIRHALVFDNESRVDETDALFMVGACASFVSYLLAHSDANLQSG